MYGKTNSKSLKIKNDLSFAMPVSFGYTRGQLESFVLWIAPKRTIEIKNWVVDESTYIFLGNEYRKDYDIGHLYMIHPQKPLDVKIISSKKLRSNSMFLSNKEVKILCSKSRPETIYFNEWAVHQYVAAEGCETPKDLRLERTASSKVFYSDTAGVAALQEFVTSRQFKELQ